ncbi:hypothetical protein CYY_002684 [Polysphondylium violaceum]|uniref:Uncharacterized protein n=1 Tax=Polysphondylium violaceum TaxID=133409 RepID=A0A8J4PZS3_9MYCE|nr:hypothetical protein CYY_002684 [Polysphondylium violaceum]
MGEIEKKTLIQIETYYRDKLLNYQEKLKKDFENVHIKYIENIKYKDNDSDDNGETTIKLKELELWMKKSLLLILYEMKTFMTNYKQQQNNSNDNSHGQLESDKNIFNQLEMIASTVSNLLDQETQLSRKQYTEFETFLSEFCKSKE